VARAGEIRVEIQDAGQAFRDTGCDPADHDPGIAVAHERDAREVFIE
jgi:hypothetical protein